MFKKLLTVSMLACGMAFASAQEVTPATPLTPAAKCACASDATKCTCEKGACVCKDKGLICDCGCKGNPADCTCEEGKCPGKNAKKSCCSKATKNCTKGQKKDA